MKKQKQPYARLPVCNGMHSKHNGNDIDTQTYTKTQTNTHTHTHTLIKLQGKEVNKMNVTRGVFSVAP